MRDDYGLWQWPTFVTLVMAPILARREEAAMRERVGTRYEWYTAHVPMLVPRLGRQTVAVPPAPEPGVRDTPEHRR